MVSVLNVWNTLDYLGAVLFGVMSCTLYLRFNWVVQQFRGEGASISGLVNATLIVCKVCVGV
jgi:hypothetical protein